MEKLRMAERAVEFHQQAAHRGVEERRTGCLCHVACQGESAGIMAAVGVQESSREELAKRRGHAIAAVLAAHDEIISATEAHCRTRSKASW
jgi:hypothetical protein